MRRLSLLLIILFAFSSCANSNTLSTEEASAILGDSLSKFLGPVSYSFDLTISLGQEEAESISDFEIHSKGSSDLSNTSKIQSKYKLELSSSKQGGTPTDIETEVMQISSDFYMRVLSPLASNWKKIDTNNLKAGFGMDNILEENSYYGPQLGDLDQLQREKLASFLRENNLVKINTIYPDMLLKGTVVHHFSAELRSEGLRDYLLKAASIEEKALTQDEIHAIKELSQNTYALLEVYIGKNDHLLYRVSGNINNKRENKDSKISINGIYNIILSNYGKRMHLEAPDEYQDLSNTAVFDEIPEKINSPECQELLQELQALDIQDNKTLIVSKTRELREKCQ